MAGGRSGALGCAVGPGMQGASAPAPPMETRTTVSAPSWATRGCCQVDLETEGSPPGWLASWLFPGWAGQQSSQTTGMGVPPLWSMCSNLGRGGGMWKRGRTGQERETTLILGFPSPRLERELHVSSDPAHGQDLSLRTPAAALQAAGRACRPGLPCHSTGQGEGK